MSVVLSNQFYTVESFAMDLSYYDKVLQFPRIFFRKCDLTMNNLNKPSSKSIENCE